MSDIERYPEYNTMVKIFGVPAVQNLFFNRDRTKKQNFYN